MLYILRSRLISHRLHFKLYSVWEHTLCILYCKFYNLYYIHCLKLHVACSILCVLCSVVYALSSLNFILCALLAVYLTLCALCCNPLTLQDQNIDVLVQSECAAAHSYPNLKTVLSLSCQGCRNQKTMLSPASSMCSRPLTPRPEDSHFLKTPKVQKTEEHALFSK